MNAPQPNDRFNCRTTCCLPDGRQLGYAEFGDPDAPPVLYFHGFPGSRLEAGLLPVKGVRLIGVDRPGYGASDPRFGRSLADWPSDIATLADHLGIDRFAIVGVSGGAPYAASCAHALADRLTATALVCGLGPPEAPGMRSGRLDTLLSIGKRPVTRAVLSALGRQIVLSDRAIRQLRDIRQRRAPRPAADQAIMQAEGARLMLQNWREGLRSGSQGMASDARVYGRRWHFDLEDIEVPIYVWHGHADTVVPSSIGSHYMENVPGAVGTFTDHDGHISIVVNHAESIVDALLSHD